MGYFLRNKAKGDDDWSLESTEREPVSYLDHDMYYIFFNRVSMLGHGVEKWRGEWKCSL
jgi:hypothetical protein